MIHLHLTEDQRQELHRVSRQAVGRVALRAHMVLLSGRAYTVPQIATIHACGQDVVRTWLHRYGAEGVGGLEDESRSGRPPQDALAAQIVDTQASQSPPCSGHVQTCWTVATLAVKGRLKVHQGTAGQGTPQECRPRCTTGARQKISCFAHTCSRISALRGQRVRHAGRRWQHSLRHPITRHSFPHSGRAPTGD